MGSTEEIWLGFSAAARFCAAVSLILLLIKFGRLSLSFRVLAVVLLNELITDSLASILYDSQINNMPLLHLYTLISFWLISLFFRELFKEKDWVKQYFWPYMVFVTLLLAINSMWLEPLGGFNSNAKALVQVLFIAYGVYYMFDAFGRIDLLQPQDLSISLVSTAILIYNAGSLFIFMFAKLLNNGLLSSDAQSGLWMVNSLLYLVFQLLLLLAIWVQVFKATKSSS